MQQLTTPLKIMFLTKFRGCFSNLLQIKCIKIYLDSFGFDTAIV